jgi:hypothetical protein
MSGWEDWPAGVDCVSTHGGTDYGVGTYVNRVGDVICGCGRVIARVDPGSWHPYQPSFPEGYLVPLPDWVVDKRPIEEQGR